MKLRRAGEQRLFEGIKAVNFEIKTAAKESGQFRGGTDSDEAVGILKCRRRRKEALIF